MAKLKTVAIELLAHDEAPDAVQDMLEDYRGYALEIADECSHAIPGPTGSAIYQFAVRLEALLADAQASLRSTATMH